TPSPEAQADQRYALHRLIEGCAAESVLVVSHGGDTERAFWGANMTALALSKGITGLVTDGAVRDLAHLRNLPFAVFSKGVTPRGGGNRFYAPLVANGPLTCGGVLITPGDLLVGDDDGVVVLRAEDAEAILREIADQVA